MYIDNLIFAHNRKYIYIIRDKSRHYIGQVTNKIREH